MSNPRNTAIKCEMLRGCSFAESLISPARIAANSGTVTGSGVVFDRGATLDGTQYIDFDIVPQELPATAVIRFLAEQISSGILAGNANLTSGTPEDGFCVWVDENGIKATYSDGTSIETALEIDLSYADGEIHTVTYVIGASAHTLYVDTETPATAATTVTGPIGETTAMMIGGDGSDNFIGTIQKVRIFDAELTPGEHAIYANDTLTSFMANAWAAWKCAVFGDDVHGNYIWDNKIVERDLTKGDGEAPAKFPEFVQYPDHDTEYYSFDGIDDYVSGWPEMPSSYTISGVFSASYPGGKPYVIQVNDTTIQALLTTPGGFAGNLHNLMVFEGELEPIQKYHLGQIQLARTWRETYVDPLMHRLIMGTCILSQFYEDPSKITYDFSNVENTVVHTDTEWDTGVSFPLATSKATIQDSSDIRSSKITIHAEGVFLPDTTERFIVSKGANYAFSMFTIGPYTRFKFNGQDSPLLSLGYYSSVSVTCKDGAPPTFYVDGLPVGSTLNPATLDASDTSGLTIGNDASANNLNGTLRRVSVYTDTLSSTEIYALHLLSYGLDPVASMYTSKNGSIGFTTGGTVGKQIAIDWGDGSGVETYTLNGTSWITPAHTYSTSDVKRVIIRGDFADVTMFNTTDPGWYGDIADLLPMLIGCQYILINGTGFTGDTASIAALYSQSWSFFHDTDIVGELADLSGVSTLQKFSASNSEIHGVLNDLYAASALNELSLQGQLVSVANTPLPPWTTMIMNLSNSRLSSDSVDNLLNQTDAAGGTSSGAQNMSLTGKVSAGSNASALSLYNIENTKGWNISHNRDTRPITVDGDSIALNWSPYLSGSEVGLSTVFSYAVGGDTLANMLANYATRGQVTKPFHSQPGWIVVSAGTNDIYFGADSSAVIATREAYIAAAIADGYQVVEVAILPRGPFDAAQEADRVAVNASRLANPSGRLTYVDVPSSMTDPTDTAYYSDGTHLTVLGRQTMAAAIDAAMDAHPSSLVLGNNNTVTTASLTAGVHYLCKFTAGFSGLITHLAYYVAGGTDQCKIDLYDDDGGGDPDNLLYSDNDGLDCIPGWNIFKIDNTPVTNGLNYHIGLAVQGSNFTRNDDAAGGSNRFLVTPYASYVSPAVYPGGYTGYTGNKFIVYALGRP